MPNTGDVVDRKPVVSDDPLSELEKATLTHAFEISRGPIAQITVPRLPQFRFEYHSVTMRVYVIRVGGHPEIADCIHDKVPDRRMAQEVVRLWCNGYLERVRETALPKVLTHGR